MSPHMYLIDTTRWMISSCESKINSFYSIIYSLFISNITVEDINLLLPFFWNELNCDFKLSLICLHESMLKFVVQIKKKWVLYIIVLRAFETLFRKSMLLLFSINDFLQLLIMDYCLSHSIRMFFKWRWLIEIKKNQFYTLLY